MPEEELEECIWEEGHQEHPVYPASIKKLA